MPDSSPVRCLIVDALERVDGIEKLLTDDGFTSSKKGVFEKQGVTITVCNPAEAFANHLGQSFDEVFFGASVSVKKFQTGIDYSSLTLAEGLRTQNSGIVVCVYGADASISASPLAEGLCKDREQYVVRTLPKDTYLLAALNGASATRSADSAGPKAQGDHLTVG